MFEQKKIIDTGFDYEMQDGDPKMIPAPYYAMVKEAGNKPGAWNYSEIHIIERKSRNVIGSYVRNYSREYRTFHPFNLRGKWYALYSKDYTSTRIMSLPDCKDLCGEFPRERGFCPVDYHVPVLQYVKINHHDDCDEKIDPSKPCSCQFKHKDGCPLGEVNPKIVDGGYEWEKCICKKEREAYGLWRYKWIFPDRIHGFVAGCVWGDDSSWKIQYLDLSRADEGIIKREERFGRISLADNLNLDQSVSLEMDDEDDFILKITTGSHYDIKTGERHEI